MWGRDFRRQYVQRRVGLLVRRFELERELEERGLRRVPAAGAFLALGRPGEELHLWAEKAKAPRFRSFTSVF